MKIIKWGIIPPPKMPWWTKQVITCDVCGAQFKLEESDNPIQGGDRSMNGEQWVECKCPTCNKQIKELKKLMRD